MLIGLILIGHFPDQAAPRQIFDLTIEAVQTSCGFGVPMMDFVGVRGQLEKWADAKGPEGIFDYWKEKNMVSIDGKPTGLKIPD